MIDHEKISHVLNLAVLYHKNTDAAVWIECGWGFGTKCRGSFVLTINGKDTEFDSFDELIFRLQELTNTNTGYTIGQTVWKLNDNHEPQDYIIEQVDGNSIEKYTINDYEDWYREEELWPSLDALIQHQLSYWAKQAVSESETPRECDHTYVLLTDDPACIKCGRPYADDCDHEYENDFGKDERPRYEKAKNPKCNKCGEFYR